MEKYRTHIGWVVGLALIVALFIYAGPSIFQKIVQVNLLYLFLGLLSTAVIMFTTTYRWRIILHHLVGPSVPSLPDLLHYVLTGAAVGVFVPRDMGEMSVRIASMKLDHEVALSKTAFSVFLDRFFDVLILIPFTVAALPFLSGRILNHKTLLGLDVILLLLFVGVLSYRHSYDVLLAMIHGIYVPIHSLLGQISLLRRIRLPQPQAIGLLSEVLSPRVMVGAFFCTLIKFLALALKASLLVSAMHLNISFFSIFLSMPLAHASYMLAFTPGGLGIGEVGWYGALILFGANSAEVAPFLLGQRMFNYLFLLILVVMGQVVRTLMGTREEVPGGSQ
jgi:uncharacterized protein (TIRG00374 family)